MRISPPHLYPVSERHYLHFEAAGGGDEWTFVTAELGQITALLRYQLVPGSKVEFSAYLLVYSCLRREKSILISAYLKVNSSVAKFQRSVVLTLVL